MLSVIVVLFNMQREAPRTLYSLSSLYQAGVCEKDYEVIVIDNGSSQPMPAQQVMSFGSNFQYIVHGDTAALSPCRAINDAVALAKGDYVGVMIDGARIASPGLIRHALDALRLYDKGIVATLAWHLGPKPQSLSIKDGYCQDKEDQLLDSIEWKKNGYLLFNISSFAWSSSCGYFGNLPESNAFFMDKSFYSALEGFDERFCLPGGGLANLDFYKRACESLHAETVLLLGEGTFHQVHGGIATNAVNSDYIELAMQEYYSIKKMKFNPPISNPALFGRPTRESFPWIALSISSMTQDR
jgi:glycosyltransferase involved in cell wall biosynthesis